MPNYRSSIALRTDWRTCLRPCQIWKTLFAGLDKEVHNLKEKVSNTNKTIKELEDSVDINDGEIADLKRDLRASDKSIDDLQEHYSRRENLMFMGIAETNAMDGQGTQQEPQNTKERVYKFMEAEMQISNPRGSIEFQRIHRVGKPKQDGPRPIIAIKTQRIMCLKKFIENY